MDNEVKILPPAGELPNDSGADIIVLNFADSAVPVFKEVRNKDYILYGEKNDYPQYLTYLYDKCATHAAIVNGKSKYIFGSGIKRKTDSSAKSPSINRYGETLDSVFGRSVKDVEIYGGFRWVVIWGRNKKAFEIFHVEFQKIRRGKEGGYWYKNNWADIKETAIEIPEFDASNPVGRQLFSYNEYRPGTTHYPLPEYLACNNYIETDIEISKYYLSIVKNGMMPSKLVQFNTGNPTDDKKKEIERRWTKKFAGSESAGRFILVFNDNKDKAVTVDDLSATEADKMFDLLNKTTDQKILTGHQVVSPMLFGIKTEGQLGGANELNTAHEIFINTYAKSKQQNYEEIINKFMGLKGLGEDFYFEQLDPIGLQISISDVIDSIPKQFVFEKLNIPKDLWGLPNIGSDTAKPAGMLPAAAGGADKVQQDSTGVNDNIKNLTTKQHQQLLRIIRQYSKGVLTKEAASVLLKTGLGLSDDDINTLLGVEDQPAEQFNADDDDSVIRLFAACGDPKSDYHVIKSKKVKFSSDDDAFDDEINFYTQAFKTADVTNTEASILDLISKDKNITPEIIADTLGTTPEFITNKIASLTKKGLLKSKTVKVGDDTQVQRTLTKPLKDVTGIDGPADTTEIFIKYSYEGPQDSRNRPFCAKLMELDRLYSRSEIESISRRLGYSVFDRRGGFWRHSDGTTTPYCRHNWQSNVLVKKGGKEV